MIIDKKHFIFVGNNTALDFLNTKIYSAGNEVDLLQTIDDLTHWAQSNPLYPIVLTTLDSNLAAVKELRTHLKLLIDAKKEGQVLPKTSLAVLNLHLLNAPSQQQISYIDQEVVLEKTHSHLSLSMLLGQIAQSAAEILISANKHPIKCCASEKCILLFVDTSRAKKRRWCSMDMCGYRAKAAAFYQASKPCA